MGGKARIGEWQPLCTDVDQFGCAGGAGRHGLEQFAEQALQFCQQPIDDFSILALARAAIGLCRLRQGEFHATQLFHQQNDRIYRHGSSIGLVNW
jgi:hypothetical protein